MYLTEAPLAVIFILTLIFNSSASGLLKLYPLMLASLSAIVFILVYLFRFVTVSVEEIKIFGLFSSRDKAIINKGKTLILSRSKKGVCTVTLFGNDGERPMLDWTQGEDYVPVDINLFRERIYGGRRSFKRILRFFGVSPEDTESILSKECDSLDYGDFKVLKDTAEGREEIRIYFNETL
jgi:hypothetical protein